MRLASNLLAAVLFAALGALLLVPNAEAGSYPNYTIGNQLTYRACTSTAVQANEDFLELRGVSGHVGRLKQIVITKPSAQFTLTVLKHSTLDTGGTPVSVPIIPMDSQDAAASLVCYAYTATPTAGTLVGDIVDPHVVATTDYIVIDFGAWDKQAPTVRSGEAIALHTDTAATVSYALEWTEDTK